MQKGTAAWAGEQLTEQVRLILSREAAGEVDCVGKIRHGYDITVDSRSRRKIAFIAREFLGVRDAGPAAINGIS